ncbi:MAG: DUF4034 domain-containing protein [Pseudomonadota bacterium]
MRTIIAGLCCLLLGFHASAQDKRPFVGADRALRNQIIYEVQTAWRDSNFDRLERMAEEFTTGRLKTLTGKWRLAIYETALSSAFVIQFPREFYETRCDCQVPSPRHYADAEPGWNALAAKADAWIAKYPRSPHAINIKAAYLMRRAWFYRGSGYADTVPAEAWPMFESNFAKARALLESTRNLSVKSPLWFSNMFKVASAQSWPQPAFGGLIKDFLANGRNYPEAYLAAFSGMQPRWGGSFEAMDTFARDAAARTRGEEGAGLYTRLYWNIYGSYGNGLFEQTRLDWKLMRQGFLDIIARFPDSWNFNGFAMFSCLARDYSSAAAAFKQMGDGIDQNFWQQMSLPECQRASAAVGTVSGTR